MGCAASHQRPPTGNNYKRNSSVSNGTITGMLQQTDIIRFLGYPPVVPPITRKNDIFNLEDVKELDERVKDVPVDVLYSSYKDLADHLTSGLHSELLCVRAIFRWLCMLDLERLQKTLRTLPEQGTPCDYALKIKWRMGNLAHFFAQIARAAGLACVVVSGINKSAAYKLGVPIDRQAMAALWNAVYVAGEWRLLDVFWASTVLVGKKSRDWTLIDDDGGVVDDDDVANDDQDADEEEGETVHTVNEFFFLTDPDQLIWTHLPDDSQWQLLPKPISEVEFESNVYIRERFFDLSLSLVPESHRKYFIYTVNGKVVIKLGLDTANALQSQFRYLLYKNRDPGEKTPAIQLERFVFFEKSDHSITYTAHFPVSGVFKMELFGQNPREHDSLDLVCSYLIDCRDPRPVEPLPVCPDIGWGPGLEAEDKGLEALTHRGGVVETGDGQVEIRFRTTKSLNVAKTLKHNRLDEWLLERFAVVRKDDQDVVVELRLPTDGQFALEMFADEQNSSGELPNICNYLIKCSNDDITPAPFPNLHEGILGRSPNCEMLRVEAISHPADNIQTDDEHLAVVFRSEDPDVELTCELQHNDISSEILSQTVLRSRLAELTTFNIGLPKQGEYALNVYARRKGEPNRLYHVHSYLVHSKQTKRFQTEKPKKPELVIPIVTNKPELAIPVLRGKGELVGEFSKKNAPTAPGPGTVKAEMSGKHGLFKLTLPENGEYKLDVYDHAGSSGLQHLATYHICTDTDYEEPAKPVVERDLSAEKEAARKEKVLAAKQKAAKEQLKAAMSSQDKEFLEEAIRHYQGLDAPEQNSGLSKAKQLLKYLQLSEELTVAMTERNIKKLDAVVSAIEKSEAKAKLHLQLAMAKRILEQLKRIEKLRHAIMKLDQRTIAEIKSYSTPPETVNKVMIATFLLLGERERRLREWNQIVVQLGKTGRSSLKQRVSVFDVDKLPIAVAARVKDILSQLNLDEVRDVSSGAATFYVWSKGMIEECESRFVQNGGDMSTVRPRRR